MLVYGSCMLISYLVFFITLGKCRALLPICEHLRFRAHICMIFFFYSFLGVAKPYSAAEKIVDYISDKEKHNPYNVSPSVSDLYKILKLWKV